MRLKIVIASVLALACLAGCGGSSGSSGSSGSGGSLGSGGSSQVIAKAAPNVASLVVDCGPSSICGSTPAVNEAYVSVTICTPSTTTCQTFDHIQIDTQSYGLRILASATDTNGKPLNSGAYPAETDSSGNGLAECTVFADGYSWGPLVTADVEISGEKGSSVPMQVIGDQSGSYATVPSTCTSTGTSEDTVSAYGANGILGVGVFVPDCGSGCAPGGPISNTQYYSCTSASACTEVQVANDQQVSNPVAYFTASGDDNGVIVELPSVSSSGATSVTGALVFGIGTQGNNGVGSAMVFQADPSNGTIDTDYKNQMLSGSIVDSGSNALFFSDSGITACSGTLVGFYCPNSTLNLTATLSGYSGSTTGTSTIVNFSVADAQSLNGSYAAFDNLAGSLPSGLSNAFDWGLPFFFGRNVFVAINGATTSAGTGPYYAF